MAKKILCAGAIALVVAFFGVAACTLITPQWVYQVSIQGETLGLVEDLDEYITIVEGVQARAEAQWQCDLIMNEQTAAARVRMWSPRFSSPAVTAGIEDTATYKTKGWAIVINGEIAAIVDTEQTARDVLEEVKAHYINEKKNCSLLSVCLREDVSIKSIAVTPEVLKEKEEVFSMLVCGQAENKTYVVKRGDTLSGISRSQNVPLSALREANGLKGDIIQVGQVLNLQSSKALLHVETVEEVTVTETIPYAVKYKVNPDSSVRPDTVAVAGINGLRTVTYKVVRVNGQEIRRQRIKSTVTKEPQTKVVLTGIGYWPARPKGMFRFPVNGGRISSYFGVPRPGGRRHTGIDVPRPRGTPVYAAASGTVTTKSRSSSYGLYIIIQHSNGYSTRYAHLSSFADIRVGSTVVRGQIIGRVGNTGNSTGSHLHWEIRHYGEPVNPLNFFGN